MKWMLAAGVTLGVVVVISGKDDMQRYLKMRAM
jgi:hypothetical protein